MQIALREQYSLLGRLLKTYRPDVASELLSIYHASQPLEDDLERLPLYYHQFCGHLGLTPSEYIGRLYKPSKTEVRKLFIAAMVHLYSPELFHKPTKCRIPATGLSKALGELFQIDESNMGRNMYQVISWQRQYDDFRAKVQDVVNHLDGYRRGTPLTQAVTALIGEPKARA